MAADRPRSGGAEHDPGPARDTRQAGSHEDHPGRGSEAATRLRRAPAGEEREVDGRLNEQQRRRERVLTQAAASIVRTISDAVVAKDGEPFFLCPPDGQVTTEEGHGYGLYHHDCRFLAGYELSLGGTRPSSLAATEAEGTQVMLELVNADIRLPDEPLIRKEQLGLTWSRRIDPTAPALNDEIEIRNYGHEPVAVPLELAFRGGFDDVFKIRGLLEVTPGTEHQPAWRDDMLVLSYSGEDGIERAVRLSFEPKPTAHLPTGACFDLRIAARDRQRVRVSAEIQERARPGVAPIEERAPRPGPAQERASSGGRSSPDAGWLGGGEWPLEVRTNSLVLNAALTRSLADLQILRGQLDGWRYYEAGIPWFATLFGRDALITALQTLHLDASTAADTLRLLAARRGRRVDGWRDEEPGKILHELRVGELARMREIPHTPYYGTIDATPLFLILLARHAAWTGRLDLFGELRDAIEDALRWIETYGDTDGDGYVDYRSETRQRLVNQGWKDSGDAIVTEDGSIAEPPIALPEVQGYVYRAWLEMAPLFEAAGDGDRATELRRRAAALRERFERDFWDEGLGTYVLALASGRPARVVSSNAGHVLWAGICSADRAKRVAGRLMEPDMFNGWGIRTLAASSAAYHPVGYHLGTVWPHDNSLIADGFRRYALDEPAEKIFVSMLEAAQGFPHARLPECFAGYGREQYDVPVSYPVACHPQAWAAATPPYLLASALGLEPEAFAHRLRVVRPRLPPFVEEIELRNLIVGAGRAHLRFLRSGAHTRTDVVSADGDLDVVIEDGRGDDANR